MLLKHLYGPIEHATDVLDKLLSHQWLGQHIRSHVICWTVLEIDLTILELLSEEFPFDTYMLGLGLKVPGITLHHSDA